ncbi:hypothetical protein GHT06_021363 [Daphnia sinensis]|uniref:EOG090X017N n=1 Tax=Daphnia sinensis TaxID=1820382 RepID=A0AAD5PSG2_9CRUS|nr:hypothetical protein GHT06_021363 [Daphnia sinensis]
MDSLKLKNSLALVAGLFAIHLSISFAHPVPPSSTDGVVEHKISNSQPFAHNNTTTGQGYHEAEASSEPFVLTAEAFPMDQSAFNITRSFINQFHSDPFTPASMEGPLTTDIPENTTPLPVNEEVSETVPEEERSVNVLESLLLDSERDVVTPSTDVTVDLTSLMPTEEPELQYATPFVPQDLLHLHMSVSTSPTDVSFTKGVVESRDFSSSIKLLSEQEIVSGIVGNYLIPAVDVPESQSTTSFELSGHIPATSTASPVTVASAQVPNSKELDFPNQASLTPDTVAQPVFSTSDNPTSMTLPTETSRKISVETLDALHPSIHLQTAVRKLVDMNPFLFNPTWPAEMGFHSIPAQGVTQSFGNQRSMFQTKMKPYRRMLPEFQLDPPLYHSFSPQVHPVRLRYRQPVNDGHPRAPYPHPHDNNNAIHRSFESASPKSRMFAFPGISSTRENFRFRVNWIDEITPAGSA